jgi:hypothetical protein
LAERLSGNERETYFDFGFTWRDPWTGVLHERSSGSMVKCFKLHGSLNWLRCDLCEHIYINLWGQIAQLPFSSQKTEANTCHCEHNPLRPLLIGPSFIRDIRDPSLVQVWKSTIELLRTANRWIIIGYSFPAEDIGVRSVFLRALQGRKRPPDVLVVQKGDDKATRARYALIFPKHRYRADGIEGFVSSARRNKR